MSVGWMDRDLYRISSEMTLSPRILPAVPKYYILQNKQSMFETLI